jgi:hypothetical protein
LLLSLFIFWYSLRNTLIIDKKVNLINFYAFSTQFCLYLFNYRSLRNWNVYFCWLAIAVVHLILYVLISKYLASNFEQSLSVIRLRNTLILLLLFQLFQYINVKLIGCGLVVPNGRGPDMRMDLWGERKAGIFDYK